MDGNGQPIRKFVLRRILEREFPASFVHRPKQGFIGPHGEWMLHDAATRSMLKRLVIDPVSPLQTLFRTEALAGEFGAHRDDNDNSGRLWMLLTLGLWMDAHRETRFA